MRKFDSTFLFFLERHVFVLGTQNMVECKYRAHNCTQSFQLKKIVIKFQTNLKLNVNLFINTAQCVLTKFCVRFQPC